MKKFVFWVLMLISYVEAFDGFDDIPSQFGGLNLFVGGAVQSHGGDFFYGQYTIQGALTPFVRVEGIYQKEKGMWVNGAALAVNFGIIDSMLFNHEDTDTMLEVTYPVSVGISVHRGFLFNPSTLLSIHGGLGSEYVKYTNKFVGNAETVEDSSLFVDAGIKMTLGILMKWGVEIDLDVRANHNEETVLANGVLIKPSRFSWIGRFGVVYHPES